MTTITSTISPLPVTPLLYDAAYEKPEEDEAETTQEFIETLQKIADTVRKDEGHAYRSVHAKSQALLLGRLTVLPDLPPALAQGVFAQAGSYPVAMRFSTAPGDVLHDAISTPRGLAVKLVGVQGERAVFSAGQATQDFVMVNGPAFSAPNAKKFLKTLKLLASTTDKAPGLKKALAATLRGVETLVEKAGGESATLKAMGGHPETHVLGETFYTQVPMRFGPYMAKLSVAPVSPELVALTDAPVDLSDRPNGLRDAAVEHFATQGGVWEVRVQLCTDIETMPIEDASVAWPEDQSPYIAVARIETTPQVAWSEARAAAVDDGMSFSPWHTLAAHQPIGSIMRVRKTVYEQTAKYRSQHSGTPMQEPTALESLPG